MPTYTVLVKTTATWNQHLVVDAENYDEAKELAEEEATMQSYTVGDAKEFTTKSVRVLKEDVTDDDFYTPSPGVKHYGMFSDEGNLAVARALTDPRKTIYGIQQDVIKQGFLEADDTAVREAIAVEWLEKQQS